MKHLAAALTGVAIATALLGVGGGAALGSSRSVTVHQPAARIFAEAEAATLSAKSVTLTEHLVLDGKPLYVKVKGRWPNRVELSIASEGVSEEIVVISSTVYVEANTLGWESGYRLQAAAAQELAGRWFTTSLSDPELGASLASLNPKSLERQVFSLVAKAFLKALRPACPGGRPPGTRAFRRRGRCLRGGHRHPLCPADHRDASEGSRVLGVQRLRLLDELPGSDGSHEPRRRARPGRVVHHHHHHHHHGRLIAPGGGLASASGTVAASA